MAVVSLVCGIAAWVICPFVAGLIAVFTGHAARGEIARSGEGGDGLAVAGLILGYLNVGGALIFGVIWLLFVMIFAAAAGGAHVTASPLP